MGDDGGEGPGTGNASTLLLKWKRRLLDSVVGNRDSSTGTSTTGLKARAGTVSVSVEKGFRRSEKLRMKTGRPTKSLASMDMWGA